MPALVQVLNEDDGLWYTTHTENIKVVKSITKKFLWWSWTKNECENIREVLKRAVKFAKELRTLSNCGPSIRVRYETLDLYYTYWKNGVWLD